VYKLVFKISSKAKVFSWQNLFKNLLFGAFNRVVIWLGLVTNDPIGLFFRLKVDDRDLLDLQMLISITKRHEMSLSRRAVHIVGEAAGLLIIFLMINFLSSGREIVATKIKKVYQNQCFSGQPLPGRTPIFPSFVDSRQKKIHQKIEKSKKIENS
jgi:hypothetical protein